MISHSVRSRRPTGPGQCRGHFSGRTRLTRSWQLLALGCGWTVIRLRPCQLQHSRSIVNIFEAGYGPVGTWGKRSKQWKCSTNNNGSGLRVVVTDPPLIIGSGLNTACPHQTLVAKAVLSLSARLLWRGDCQASGTIGSLLRLAAAPRRSPCTRYSPVNPR